MLRSRVIPCLLLHKKGLVKTVKFSDAKYVGDPINTVKIFNEKEVDELMVLDIDATVNGSEPNFDLIEKLALESRMPLCIGGGIKSVEQARRILQLGVEKVALSSAAIENALIVNEIASAIGSQSVVVVIDVKKTFLGSYSIFTHNGKRKIKRELNALLSSLEEHGVGEIVINSIDKDGVLSGYDLNLVDQVRDKVDVPITVLGGAGDKEDIFQLVKRHKIIGAGAGSLFVFKGKYKAVLVNYLSRKDISTLRDFSTK